MPEITYCIDNKNFYPDHAEGMHTVFCDRTDSFRATMIPDIVYVERHRPLHLQMLHLVSTEPDRKYPLIVYVQGSGYRKQDYYRPLPQLASLVHQGYIVVTVEYRFTDEGGLFPAQVQDVRAAVRFLKAHAQDYQIDKERVALWGDSSGGHTIALAAIGDDPEFDTPEYVEEDCSVKCCVDFYGVYEMEGMESTLTPEMLAYFEGDPMEKLFGGPLKEHPEEVARASVGAYIRPGRTLPPFLLIHGDEDPKVPFTQSLKFYKKLRENDYSVELYKVKGGGHGNRVWTEQTMEIATEFLKAYL